MELAPFGILNNEHQARIGREGGLWNPMPDWPGDKASFRALMSDWLDEITESVWPAWEAGAWKGGSAANKEVSAKNELQLAIELYHGGGSKADILKSIPDVPPVPVGPPRDQEWHYKIEDALVLDRRFLHFPHSGEPSYDFLASSTIGSNFIVYDPTFPIKQFESLFWGRMRRIEPPIFNIKQYLQRPRPWTAATALSVVGFRWVVAGNFFVTHTGVHPSLLSGHCIQGVLGGCSVFEALLDTGETITADRKRAIQKYMVDWGDRRVFAGVHYMTDNIASWTLARRLIPHLFRHADEVEQLAVEAIIQQSQVFKDIITHFDDTDPSLALLRKDFPEAVATS